MAVLSTHRALARVWLPGVGCRHFRSSPMSDAEAMQVLTAIQDYQKNGSFPIHDEQPFELYKTGNRGRVLVWARHLPEPDAIGPNLREYEQWFALVATPHMRVPTASEVFQSLPTTQPDADALGWCRLKMEGAGSAKKTPAQANVIAAPPLPPITIVSRLRWKLIAALLGLAIAFVVLVMVFRNGSQSGDSKRDLNGTNLDTTAVVAMSQSEKADWEDVKVEIRATLREHNPHGVDGLDDSELLHAFRQLFERPKLRLDEEERASLIQFRTSDRADSDPFLKFWYRFPEKLPAPTISSEQREWSALARDQLVPLAEVMRKAGVEVRKHPSDLVIDLKKALAYEEFFEVWSKDRKSPPDLWCKSSNEPWRTPMRDIIRQRFSSRDGRGD